MKKLILSLLKSAVGKAIIQIIIDAFLKMLQKKGYYLSQSSASAKASSGSWYGNVLNSDQLRQVMVLEFMEDELENVKP